MPNTIKDGTPINATFLAAYRAWSHSADVPSFALFGCSPLLPSDALQAEQC
jgi:hypothetical protein